MVCKVLVSIELDDSVIQFLINCWNTLTFESFLVDDISNKEHQIFVRSNNELNIGLDSSMKVVVLSLIDLYMKLCISFKNEKMLRRGTFFRFLPLATAAPCSMKLSSFILPLTPFTSATCNLF